MRKRELIPTEHQAWLTAYLERMNIAKKDYPNNIPQESYKRLRGAYRQYKLKLTYTVTNTLGDNKPDDELKALDNSLKLKEENERLRDKLSRLKQSDLTESLISITGFKPLLPMYGVFSIDEFRRLESRVKALRKTAQGNKDKRLAHDALLESSEAMSKELNDLKDQEIKDNKTIANQIKLNDSLQQDVADLEKLNKSKQKELDTLKGANDRGVAAVKKIKK